MTAPVVHRSDFYAPIADDLPKVVAAIDRELKSDLPLVNEFCERLRGYRGKMLRPSLLLLCARASGRMREEHIVLAAVVELVHMATLVHDDVLDEAKVRRRHPTINHVSGNEAAVMLGDYLISHAFHLCSSLDSQYASRWIGRTTNLVCEGELLQIHHRNDRALTESTYLEIIRRKTAVLTATSCHLGAHFADADVELVNRLERFGEHAGVAFQVADDVLDLTGETQQMGKTLGRDVELGEMTLPIIHCLASGCSAAAELSELLRSEAVDRGRIANLCRSTGSIEYALDVARDHVQQAVALLDGMADSPARGALGAMAEFIVQRQL